MEAYPDINQYIIDFNPWLFFDKPYHGYSHDQEKWQEYLRNSRQFKIASSCYISRLACIAADSLEIEENSYVAAYSHLTHDIKLGKSCSINVFTAIRGKVSIGNDVRIGAQTSVLGFNHTFECLNLPIHEQSLSFKGIEIGNDVWIGSNVTILDGVKIGDHCVIGAGAVVTKDIPAYSVAVGNPAKIIRSRLDKKADPHIVQVLKRKIRLVAKKLSR